MSTWQFFLIGAILVAVGVISWLISARGRVRFESPEKRAGRQGEKLASIVIRETFDEDDVLLSNVEVHAGGKEAEMDSVVVNEHGVFIIEVKNYHGQLFGSEDDYEWIKNKTTQGGNTYQHPVKNPIRQVKRQIYVLSRFLKAHGVRVWVEGYVFFIEMNSPVESPYVLKTRKDIDRVIHSDSKKGIDDATRERIINELRKTQN